jgi:DNA-binding ferritin-like protein (Dps family)
LSPMSSYEYNQLLKFLYFEGYADSYAEAEELLESMSDEEFEEIVEAFKEPDLDKMKRQEYRHQKQSTSQKGGSRGDSKNRASKMSSIRSALERGEDPRADGYGGARAARGNPPEDHRAAFSKNPLNNPPRKVKEPGVKEELEMQEAWYSGKGQYRTTTSGRKVRWDEDDATDTAVSDMLQKRREAAAKKAKQEKLKAQGLKRKDGTPVFEEVIEYLFVEGFADTIENAEVMAENISENWVNEIMEAKVDWHNRDKENVQDRVRVLRDRNKRLQSDRPEIPSGRDQTDFRTKRHKDSRGKTGSVTEENYETKVQPPREPLKTDRNMFTISQKEKDAARERTLAKAKAMRAKKGIE